MSRLTVLNWTRRHRCQQCGARSMGRSIAGDMTATRTGWLCALCLDAETCNSPAREVEPAPHSEAIAGESLSVDAAASDSANANASEFVRHSPMRAFVAIPALPSLTQTDESLSRACEPSGGGMRL